jgi:hypothetical protein
MLRQRANDCWAADHLPDCLKHERLWPAGLLMAGVVIINGVSGHEAEFFEMDDGRGRGGRAG